MARFDRLASGATAGILALLMAVPIFYKMAPPKTNHTRYAPVSSSETRDSRVTKTARPRVDAPSFYTPILAATPQSSVGDNWNTVKGGVTAMGVPEPSSWALMLVGLGGIGASLRRRATRPAA